MAVLGCCFQRIITFNKAQEPNRETKIERNPRGWILGLQIGQTAQGRCNPWEIPEVLCYMLNQELFQNSFGYSVLRCLDGFIISSTFFGPVLTSAPARFYRSKPTTSCVPSGGLHHLSQTRDFNAAQSRRYSCQTAPAGSAQPRHTSASAISYILPGNSCLASPPAIVNSFFT